MKLLAHLTVIIFLLFSTAVQANRLLVETYDGRTKIYDLADVGYAYEAGRWCKQYEFIVQLDDAAFRSRSFKSGRSIFQTATRSRSVSWACDTAFRTSKGLLETVAH